MTLATYLSWKCLKCANGVCQPQYYDELVEAGVVKKDKQWAVAPLTVYGNMSTEDLNKEASRRAASK